MLATIREVMITPMARKIASSREGKADPSLMASGKVRTPASVVAPRTPQKDMAATIRQLGTRRQCP